MKRHTISKNEMGIWELYLEGADGATIRMATFPNDPYDKIFYTAHNGHGLGSSKYGVPDYERMSFLDDSEKAIIKTYLDEYYYSKIN